MRATSKSTSKSYLFAVLMLAGLAYVAVDAWFGDPGGAQIADLNAERRDLQEQIDALEARRDALEARSDGLKAPRIDAELLEERLRSVFGLIAPDEVVLIAPEPDETTAQ